MVLCVIEISEPLHHTLTVRCDIITHLKYHHTVCIITVSIITVYHTHTVSAVHLSQSAFSPCCGDSRVVATVLGKINTAGGLIITARVIITQ